MPGARETLYLFAAIFAFPEVLGGMRQGPFLNFNMWQIKENSGSLIITGQVKENFVLREEI